MQRLTSRKCPLFVTVLFVQCLHVCGVGIAILCGRSGSPIHPPIPQLGALALSISLILSQNSPSKDDCTSMLIINSPRYYILQPEIHIHQSVRQPEPPLFLLSQQECTKTIHFPLVYLSFVTGGRPCGSRGRSPLSLEAAVSLLRAAARVPHLQTQVETPGETLLGKERFNLLATSILATVLLALWRGVLSPSRTLALSGAFCLPSLLPFHRSSSFSSSNSPVARAPLP